MIKLKNLFLFFTLALPKAGAKISGFPLYLSLLSSLYFFCSGFFFLLKKPRELFFLIIPLVTFLISMLFCALDVIPTNGISNYHINNGELVGYISSLFSFVCYYGALKIRNHEVWKKYLLCIFYMLVIYSFMQKIFGDYAVVIPGITANLQDALTPYFLQDKNNMIWGIGYLKATSTYQNGNVFGVNLLLIGFAVVANAQVKHENYFLPLAFTSITVILTASASIYFGLLIVLAYMLFLGNKRGVLLTAFFFLGLLLIVVMSTDNIISHMIYERIFNRDLSAAGGRSDKIFEYIDTVTAHPELLIFGMLFYQNDFSQIYEILPLSIIQIFGLPIFIFICIFFFCKLKPLIKTPYILPFIAYFSASISDGAFWLPPTATNLGIMLGLCTLWKNALVNVEH